MDNRELVNIIIEATKIYEDVGFIGKYDDVCELLECLIKKTDFNIVAIELEPEEYDDYDKEYYLSICNNDLYVEKCYKFDKYLYTESDVMFIDEDLLDNEDLMDSFGCDDLVVVPSEDNCDECDTCCECSCYEDSDDDMPGFTFSRNDDRGHTTYSFYSSDRDLVDDMAEYVKKIFS